MSASAQVMRVSTTVWKQWVQNVTSRAFQWAIDVVRTLPLTPPKGGSKNEFVVFVNKIQV